MRVCGAAQGSACGCGYPHPSSRMPLTSAAAAAPPSSLPCAHRATAGVSARVMGVRMGNRALLHRKARARVEPPPVSTLSSQPFSLASSFSAASSYSPPAPESAGGHRFRGYRRRYAPRGRRPAQPAQAVGRMRGAALALVQEHEQADGDSLDSRPIFCKGPFTSTLLSIAR